MKYIYVIGRDVCLQSCRVVTSVYQYNHLINVNLTCRVVCLPDMTPNHHSNSLYLLQSQRNVPNNATYTEEFIIFFTIIELTKHFYWFSFEFITNITFLPITNNLPHQQLSNFLYLAILKMPKAITIHYTINPPNCNDNPFLMYKSGKIPGSFFLYSKNKKSINCHPHQSQILNKKG